MSNLSLTHTTNSPCPGIQYHTAVNQSTVEFAGGSPLFLHLLNTAKETQDMSVLLKFQWMS